MLSKFYKEAIDELAASLNKDVKKVTAAELAAHLEKLFTDDPLVGFSAPDAELYHQSGRVTAVPVGATGILMDDYSSAVSIIGGVQR